jgi:hypothetical protein
MNTASQVIAFVYAKVFATMPVECLDELLRQCDTSTIKTGRHPHSEVRSLISAPVLTDLAEESAREPLPPSLFKTVSDYF